MRGLCRHPPIAFDAMKLLSPMMIRKAMALRGYDDARLGLSPQCGDASYVNGYTAGARFRRHAEKSANAENSANAESKETLKQAERLEKQSREYGTGIRRAIMPDPIWKSVRVYHAIQPGKEWQHLKDTSTLAEIREMFK